MSSYQVGDISQKTNLQKQNDGSWKPVGKEKTTKEEEIKPEKEKAVDEQSTNKQNYQDFGDKDKFFHDLYSSNYDDVIGSLSDVEHIALDKYRDTDYFGLNKSLRETDESKKIPKFTQQAELISKAIQKSKLKHDIILKRGIQANGEISKFFSELKPGDVYSDKAFVSTTLSNSVSNKFQGTDETNPKGYDNISIEILAKKGKNALSMQNLGSKSTQTMYNDEFEFLLDKDSKFKVISNEDNKLTVELL